MPFASTWTRQSVDLYAKNTRGSNGSTGFYATRQQLEQGYGRDVLWAGTSGSARLVPRMAKQQPPHH